MNKTLAALLAAGVASLCTVARADDAPPAPPPMSKHAADKQADAQYRADVKSAEGRHAVAKAACGSSLTATGRSCKDDAGATERKDKADAKLKQVDAQAAH
jgi:hypothetical protein